MPPLDFAELFRLSPNPYMVLDRQLRYVTANAAYLRATASRLEDLQGRGVFDVFPHDPDDPSNASARMLRGSLERVLTTKAPDVLALIPYRVPMHTGSGIVVAERFWSATHTPLLDEHGEVAYILQHTVDVTGLRQPRRAAEAHRESPTDAAREALEAGVLSRARMVQEANRLLDSERRHLRSLFHQAPSFMAFLRGAEHVFELANPAYEQLVGTRSLVGKPVREALPEVVAQGFIELLDRVYTTGQPFVGRGVRILLQRQDEGPPEERYLDFIYQPILDADGKVSGIFAQGHDISEQKRVESALKQVEEEMRRFNQQLERRVQERTEALLEANKELESFSYSVSHDLRAPLRHIMGFARLLESRSDAVLDDTSRRHLKTITDSARQGGRLVDDLLEFSRMGRAELRKGAVSLSEALAEVRRELAPETEGRKVRWQVGALPEVRADPALLRLVLKNLLSNALKYSRTREESVIEVWAREGEGEVEVVVRDNGVGFEMQYVDKLFGVFQRLHRSEQFEGTGIGLANVRRIVSRHGGRTWAERVLGEGATFHFTLPRVEQAQPLSA